MLALGIAGCGGGTGGDDEAAGAAAAEAGGADDGTASAQGIIPITRSRGYLLTVTAGSGGKVMSSPSGINCGAGSTACQARYSKGTTVTLSAVPSSGYTFAGWSGACTGTSATCSVKMAANLSVAPKFAQVPVPSVPAPTEHTVALSWTAASQTAVTGYKVYHGTQSGVYTDTVSVSSPSVSYTTTTLGVHYFAVSATDASGGESARSSEVSISIP